MKINFSISEDTYYVQKCLRIYQPLNYLTGRKIVVPENFDFQYSKNFLRIRFFGIGLKVGTDLHKYIILKSAYQIFEFSYGTTIARKYKW